MEEGRQPNQRSDVTLTVPTSAVTINLDLSSFRTCTRAEGGDIFEGSCRSEGSRAGGSDGRCKATAFLIRNGRFAVLMRVSGS
jgi:hypothetical protein